MRCIGDNKIAAFFVEASNRDEYETQLLLAEVKIAFYLVKTGGVTAAERQQIPEDIFELINIANQQEYSEIKLFNELVFIAKDDFSRAFDLDESNFGLTQAYSDSLPNMNTE
uniref:Uncharacterized protein n=1 Tax=Glossina pallidipes TaxID=7398 RepID=A0A1B0AIJ5_GLOPL